MTTLTDLETQLDAIGDAMRMILDNKTEPKYPDEKE